MDTWTLYWITRLDHVHNVSFSLLFASLFVLSTVMVYAMATFHEDMFRIPKMGMVIIVSITAFILLSHILITVFVPTWTEASYILNIEEKIIKKPISETEE